ncbi:actin family [Gilbertella persicaria]|uniref:Actin-like protein 6B n=1 Tax=Rhizopus stolonifer TaxID=4846 RepID=A0A367KQP4_RHIST|nr:actin family [Gilbertella persicaria]KAI8080297.1 actin family [Gilbertella persicaria]RCI04535.1 Actin-like protein 6B [Rhizopus stolonifer]
MVTYGGDEVNALVFDMGSTSTRVGFAGEDVPKAMFPTSYGIDTNNTYYIGDSKINTWRPNMEIKTPMEDGLVKDWDAVEHIWQAAYNDMLRVHASEHPLLCTEPAWNTPENREKMMQLAFEKFDVPAFYVAKDAVMTAFSVGRATALVLDSGGSVTSAVPVYDGYVLKKGVLHQSVGGDLLTQQIRDHLKQDAQLDVTPLYKIASKKPVRAGERPQIQLRSRPNTTKSFDDYQVSRIIHEYKESVSQVSEVPFDPRLMAQRPQKPFEFPDGYNNSFGVERYRVPEIMFHPGHIRLPPTEPGKEGQIIPSLGLSRNQLQHTVGVSQLVFNSISACDMDLRPLLFNNVIVTGGNTLFPGFTERLSNDLPMMVPGNKVKVHAFGSQIERKSSSWLGGSILASLGSFNQLWISKKEYEEVGPSIIETKCQ